MLENSGNSSRGFFSIDDFVTSFLLTEEQLRADLIESVSTVRQEQQRLNEQIVKLRSAQQREQLNSAGIMTDASVLVTVIGARELIPWGIDGSSNPYAVVSVGSHSESTEVVFGTLDPQWQQCLHFPVASHADLIHIAIYDKG